MRISDWSSDVCSSDLPLAGALIAVGLLIANPRAAGWAMLGSAAGLAFSLLHHDTTQALSGLGGYNPALVALALSQQYRQRWLPLVGIVLAVMLTPRSEEHTSELQSLMRISYAVFCLKKNNSTTHQNTIKNKQINTNSK